jgi:hypothetical protein
MKNRKSKKKVSLDDIRGDSASFRALNPGLFQSRQGVQEPPQAPEGTKRPPKRSKAKELSQSERYMEALLTQFRNRGEIIDFRFEEIILVVGTDLCRYTPDFAVVRPGKPLLFVEMKGAKKWEDSIVKFKAAKKQFPFFEFQMWEHTKEGLTQLY